MGLVIPRGLSTSNNELSQSELSRGDPAMEVPIILCIDDQRTVLELRKATLESHGYCVQVASSSYAAMKILEGVPMTAVLLEYKLEGIDAEAAAWHINQRFPNLPTILLSPSPYFPHRPPGPLHTLPP